MTKEEIAALAIVAAMARNDLEYGDRVSQPGDDEALETIDRFLARNAE